MDDYAKGGEAGAARAKADAPAATEPTSAVATVLGFFGKSAGAFRETRSAHGASVTPAHKVKPEAHAKATSLALAAKTSHAGHAASVANAVQATQAHGHGRSLALALAALAAVAGAATLFRKRRHDGKR
jgi:hypothetical protein